MDELKQRSPDDLAYEVFWDSTVFVTSTIDEVVHTLVFAFILVALVVFLFLGKLRTTLIPLFAVAVSTAMLISALNALTLSPALCAVLLKRGDHRRGGLLQRGIQRVLAGIDWVRDGYVAIVRRLVGIAMVGVVAVVVCSAGAY